jgi:hypothetical protein
MYPYILSSFSKKEKYCSLYYFSPRSPSFQNLFAPKDQFLEPSPSSKPITAFGYELHLGSLAMVWEHEEVPSAKSKSLLPTLRPSPEPRSPEKEFQPLGLFIFSKDELFDDFGNTSNQGSF